MNRRSAQACGRRSSAAANLLAIVFAPVIVAGCHRHAGVAPTDGAELKVEMGKTTRLDPDTPLRCFVHGRFVGMETPARCADQNGVAPGGLDVGLDQSGALAAGGGDSAIQPLANVTLSNSQIDSDQIAQTGPLGDIVVAPSASPQGDCLRYSRGVWTITGEGVALDACVQTLFAGRCPAPGQAVYGRWGAQTLRSETGRVDMSSDNRSFHPLAAQDPQTCSVSQ